MSVYLGENLIAGSFKTGASWEVGDVGISAFGIDEALNKRRYLNGQVISQAQFVEFTAMLKSRVSVYPNLATSEVNWQAEVTNSKLGQCGKFVIDDVAGTIRLPKVVNINGLQNLTGLGEIKAESLPNIKGELDYVTRSTNTPGQGLGGSFFDTGAGSGLYGSGGARSNIGFNASRSSSTYQDDAPVQQEAVQYPYFIQVAEGVETSVDVSREIELNNPFSLLDYKYSEYELSNASWLLSNGQFNSGSVYQSVYDLLLQELNGTSSRLPYKSYINTVGNLVDTDGALSGFSGSNYAALPQDWETFTTLEFVVKFNATDFSNYGNVFAPYYDYNGFQVGFESDGRIIFRVGNGSSWSVNTTSSSAISVNTDYYVRVTYANSSYSVDISTDKETWTNYITVSSSQIPQGRICLGQGFVGSGRAQYFLKGSIDLNESYIDINGERWWTGRRKIITTTGDYTDEDYRLNTTDTTFRLPLKVALASGKAVAGNGMTLGLATDKDNFGLMQGGTGGIAYTAAYDKNIGASPGFTGLVNNGIAIGITTDETKSGIETSANGLYLYFYVGETVQDANLINAGRMSTLISQLTECHVVVETYQNGDNWYRIYSDGWCEQGGKTPGTTSGAQTITLLVEMKDTNYFVLATCYAANLYATSYGSSTTQIVVETRGHDYTVQPCKAYWEVCGYIAQENS